MKKLLIVLLSVMLMTGCSAGKKEETIKELTDAVKETTDTISETIDEIKEEVKEAVVEVEKEPEVTEPVKEEPVKEESTAKSGIRPEFQKAMDEYKEFFEEYCAFMKKYQSSDDVTSLMLDYMSYMGKYEKTMRALDKIDENELSNEEYWLYFNTMNEINAMMLESLQ